MLKTISLVMTAIFMIACSEVKLDNLTNVQPTTQAELKYGIVLDDYPGFNYQDYSIAPEHEILLQFEPIHGKKLYKAYFLCSSKYQYMIDTIEDTSTDEGSVKINEYNAIIKLCVSESLDDILIEFNNEIQLGQNQPIIPESEPSAGEYVNPKPDVNHPNYSKVHDICTKNNPDDTDAADLCTYKGL